MDKLKLFAKDDNYLEGQRRIVKTFSYMMEVDPDKYFKITFSEGKRKIYPVGF